MSCSSTTPTWWTRRTGTAGTTGSSSGWTSWSDFSHLERDANWPPIISSKKFENKNERFGFGSRFAWIHSNRHWMWCKMRPIWWLLTKCQYASKVLGFRSRSGKNFSRRFWNCSNLNNLLILTGCCMCDHEIVFPLYKPLFRVRMRSTDGSNLSKLMLKLKIFEASRKIQVPAI